ncbi:MAG: Flp family type IVb pilin [Alphaproteobacteria bacterium HGW-Alphaproteobacteria-9]|nr:MAG: Flp family type IVb pilin [Alphaproteobacteria bacterium HGW-Alphaproteobacteria-9]
MTNLIKNFLNDEAGASAAEYALLLAVIGIGIVVAAGALGSAITGALNEAATAVNTRPAPAPAP